MSMRTIVEFNHDHAHKIANDPQGFADAVSRMLNNGFTDGPLGEEIEQSLRRFGVRPTPTTHHTTERKINLGGFLEFEM